MIWPVGGAGGSIMQKTEKLDMARLLGFDTVTTELEGRLDFDQPHLIGPV